MIGRSQEGRMDNGGGGGIGAANLHVPPEGQLRDQEESVFAELFDEARCGSSSHPAVNFRF